MTYEDLRALHPHLFDNPPDAPIRIRSASGGNDGDGCRIGMVYADPYVMIVRDPVTFADGRQGTYLRLFEQPFGVRGVAALPRYEGRLVLLRHFRHASRKFHLEVPRGFGTAGLTSRENAEKELCEEIGGKSSHMEAIGTMMWNSGLSCCETDLFFAELANIGVPNRAEGIVDLVFLDAGQMETMIAADQITDSFTLVCYMRAKLRGLV